MISPLSPCRLLSARLKPHYVNAKGEISCREIERWRVVRAWDFRAILGEKFPRFVLKSDGTTIKIHTALRGWHFTLLEGGSVEWMLKQYSEMIAQQAARAIALLPEEKSRLAKAVLTDLVGFLVADEHSQKHLMYMGRFDIHKPLGTLRLKSPQ